MTASPVVDKPRPAPPKHPVDEVLPIPKLAVYGFQHVLAFYAGAVIVPILLANSIGLSQQELIHLINADLFTCGIASIIQSWGFWKVGVRLPLLQGVTFTAVSPMIAIGLAAGGGTEGLLVIYGAVIVAGLFTFFVAPYFSRLIRFFPPVVTGTVITHHRHRPAARRGQRRRRWRRPHDGSDQRQEPRVRHGHPRADRHHPAGLPRVHGHRGRAGRPGHRHRGRLDPRRRTLRRGEPVLVVRPDHAVLLRHPEVLASPRSSR